MKQLLLFIAVATLISWKTNNEITANHTQKINNENFEGIIKYKFLMDNVQGLSDEQIESKIKGIEALFGRHMVYFIREPKTKTVINGEMMKMISYNDHTDSMYIHSPDLGYLAKVSTYDDWNYKYDTIITMKNAKIVNGKSSDLIRFQSDNYTWDYYYNDQLKVNPEYFKHYQSGFWNKAIELSNSLPVRFEGKIPGGYLYMEVEEIIPQSLQDSVFELPKI